MEAQIKVVLLIVTSQLWACGSNDRELNSTRRLEPDPILDARRTDVHGGGWLVRNGDDLNFIARTGFDMTAYIPNYYNMDSTGISFEGLLTPSDDTIRVSNVIDSLTFRYVGLKESEMRCIRNPYYLNGRMKSYYVDEDNLYGYHGHPPFSLRLIGRREDMELLGGDYVRVKNEVYSDGLRIASARAESFSTMDVSQLHRKIEWELTIGLDNHHMYWGPHVMSASSFDELFDGSADSLRHAYFGATDEATDRSIQ